MKHIIIGAGCIGKATGIWFKSNNNEVLFHDINEEVLTNLSKKGYKTLKESSQIKDEKPDIIWICTAEWDTESAIQKIYKDNQNSIIVIRSTMPPGETEKIAKKYNLTHIAHVPEFLRQKVAIEDIFNKDRIIIGSKDEKTKQKLKEAYKSETIPIIFTDIATSELIKYSANCWLATQISFWNEIKKICDKLKVNPQQVANAVTLDRRISKYGSNMLGEPFGGFCFPKDTESLVKAFEKNNIDPILLKAIRKVNESLK